MRVLGLDVCKSSVVACLLTERPTEPRQLYYRTEFMTLEANAAGIRAMLELKPDVAIMEPTGVNYARLWGTHLARQGIGVFLVGHAQLRGYRKDHLSLPDKDDEADSLALACYFFDYQDSPRRFVQVREPEIVRLRELALRLSHLNRVQSPIINRLRQDLAWQFPEVQSVRSYRSDSQEIPLLWGWLAGEREASRYDNLLEASTGLGLSEETRHHAKAICALQRREAALEREIRTLLKDRRFDSYRKVFARFGFGERAEAMILSQIYPLENYLKDGEPEVIIRKGKRSGKATKRHLSARRFQKALGVAPVRDWSGDKKRAQQGGSDLCRKALWQWLFTRIEPQKSRLRNEIGELLGAELDLEKKQGKPIKLVRSRVCAKAVKLLFRELVRAIK